MNDGEGKKMRLREDNQMHITREHSRNLCTICYKPDEISRKEKHCCQNHEKDPCIRKVQPRFYGSITVQKNWENKYLYFNRIFGRPRHFVPFGVPDSDSASEVNTSVNGSKSKANRLNENV
jgi:hypothetical protein